MKANFLKKILTACFSDTPYRIKKFEALYKPTSGTAVERPESLSAVMLREEGEIGYYAKVMFLAGQVGIQKEIENSPRFIAQGFFKAPNRVIYSISGAGILGQIGLVYDPKKRCFIAESANDWIHDLKDLPYTNAYRLAKPAYLPGVTLSFLTQSADGGFYHFLLESLVKTGVFAEMMNKADHYLFNGPQTTWKQKWIERTNIDSSKIIWVTNDSHYLCDQLLFTNKLIGDQQANVWSVKTLRSLMRVGDNVPAEREKKVFWISRRDANSRAITWEEDLLVSYPDIQKLELSELTAEQTIQTFKEATHIIAPHGAGLSNIYLCSEATKILELFPVRDFFKPCYQRLACASNLAHQSLYIHFEDKSNREHGITLLSNTLNEFLC